MISPSHKIFRRKILHVILDRSYLDASSAPFASREAAGSGADIIQYRDKMSNARDFHNIVLAIKDALRNSWVPLIVNDRLDIAFAAGADGVHLGQEDLPAAAARRLGGKKFIIGVTADTLPDALAAEEGGADYLGVGAFFPTATKSDVRVIAREVFQRIAASVRIPVLAVGGVKADNLSEAIAAGASGVAVASAAIAGGSVAQAVAALREALDGR
ncbi:MAG: thiamine phosphate synthase [Candidatus Aureabacteria bacterium]|nr:thiamine phosphate synthase [Candidatus Auribacterota bacterium]